MSLPALEYLQHILAEIRYLTGQAEGGQQEGARVQQRDIERIVQDQGGD